MRTLPADFDPVVVAAIDARLDAIMTTGVAVPLAVEKRQPSVGLPIAR